MLKRTEKIPENIATGFAGIFGLKLRPATIQDIIHYFRRRNRELRRTKTASVMMAMARDFIGTGRFPGPVQIAEKTNIDKEKVDEIIKNLAGEGLIQSDLHNRIIGAVGFSAKPTNHFIHTEKGEFHTWCAMDALGLTANLELSGSINSRCPACGAEINILTRSGDIRLPRSRPVVYLGFERISKNVTEDVCPYINFFCNSKHAEKWQAENRNVAGLTLDLPEGVELSKHAFGFLSGHKT